MTRRPSVLLPSAVLLTCAVWLLAGCGTSSTAPDGQPLIVAFTATPSAVSLGAETRLAWRVSGADSVVITPDVGRVATPDSGSVSVTPGASTTYVLTAYGPAGDVQATTEVRVDLWTALPAAFSNDQPRTIEIRGAGFRAGAEVARVFFDDVEIPVAAASSDTVLEATVPAALPPKSYVVTVLPPGTLGPLPLAHHVIVTDRLTTATLLTGAIAQSRTLTAAGNPYRLVGTVTVESGAVLTLEPGVVILAEPAAGLVVLSGAALAAGGTGEPTVLTGAEGLSSARWNAVDLRTGSGPNTLRNVFLEFGGAGISTGLLRVLSSETTLRDVAVRASATAGLALALEAGGELPPATGLYAALNDAAGVFLDGGAGGTGGSMEGLVRENALGLAFANFTAADCARWDLSGLVRVANRGTNVGPCGP